MEKNKSGKERQVLEEEKGESIHFWANILPTDDDDDDGGGGLLYVICLTLT